MKRLLLTFILLLAAYTALPQCDITVTGDFDSPCLSDFKDMVTDEYPDLLVACRGSTVTYTAFVNALGGGLAPTAYTWEVAGDAVHSATGDHTSVTWGHDGWGVLTVTATLPSGGLCTKACRVKLIDLPAVAATTLPAYTLSPSGDKTITVCDGEAIEFLDRSVDEGADIAGCLWEATSGDRSTNPHFTLVNYVDGDQVTHRVYNNCGCYNEEKYLIEVLQGDALEIDCYGTVCEGDTVTYRALSPLCSDYHWYADGGTIVGGQGTDRPTVQWDRPHDGYGVLALDGASCTATCPSMLSRRIPVIHGGLAIRGVSDVCVGETVLYELPLFGSTEYRWEVTPSTGVNTAMVDNSHRARLQFTQAGTYTVSASYRCDFLDCGYLESEPLTVTVKPVLDIVGSDRVCLTASCSLQTSPAVAATWRVYDMDNGNSQVGTAHTGTAFSTPFPHTGRYLVTAEHTGHCGPATLVMNVLPAPPAPTVDDLSPDNRHTACPYQGIVLSGTPAEPHYSLVWAPACTTAAPSVYTGNDVTVGYQAEVCDVNVYHYDHLLGCLSATPYVHTVSALTAEAVTLPCTAHVCPNTLVSFGSDKVPDQSADGMLYEWTIEELKQYCASVQGSHLRNAVTLAVSDLAPGTEFDVTLTRRWCGGFQNTTVHFIVSADNTAPVIHGPDSVCVGTEVSYYATGGNASHCRWVIDNSEYSGSPVSHTFGHEGTSYVTLRYNPYDYCTNTGYLYSATRPVTVSPPPAVRITAVQGNVTLDPALSSSDYTFAWFWSNSPIGPYYSAGTNPTPNTQGKNFYRCTVTDIHTVCSVTLNFNNMSDVCTHSSFLSHGALNLCTHTLHAMAQNVVWPVMWTVTGGDAVVSGGGTLNEEADITVEDLGYYTVKAKASLNDFQCTKDEFCFMVDFLPELSFYPACTQVLIKNTSKYLDGSSILHLTVTSSCGGTPQDIYFPASQAEYLYSVPTGNTLCTYTFLLAGYGNNTVNPPCTLGTVTTGNPGATVSIGSDNGSDPHQTCNNTPIGLTATLSTGDIAATSWNFGDGGTFHTTGNRIYHTFKAVTSNNVIVTATNSLGCQYTSPAFSITSFSNTLQNGLLNQMDYNICPNSSSPVRMLFSVTGDTYTWTHEGQSPTAGPNPYPVYSPGNCLVYVTDVNFCKKEANQFALFLNQPTALIVAEHDDCCTGESVTLRSGTGPGGNLNHAWTVSDPNNLPLLSSTQPYITFTPDDAGAYTVSLTVTDPVTLCTSTATKTITAHPQPAAPSIAFSGNDCIGLGPVDLTASGFSGTLHWSNGANGTTARYYIPGIVTAYYYYPSLGCPSEKAQTLIHHQPDFDALLTGCYERCKYFFPYKLSLYGLTPEIIDWEWLLNGNAIASDQGYLPAELTLTGTGSYHLDATYQNGNCNETSPSLRLTGKDTCDCQGISVKVTRKELTLSQCKMSWQIDITVCNESENKFCIDTLLVLSDTGNVKIVSENCSGNAINPNDCQTFRITLAVKSLLPSGVLMQLVNGCDPVCTKNFFVDLMPDIHCEEEFSDFSLSLNPSFDNSVAGYFDINALLGSGDALLGFYSEPPMVLNYLYDPATMSLSGLGMFDLAQLRELAGTGEKVCFYAIVCEANQLCLYKYCINAKDLLDLLQERSDGTEGDKGPRHRRAAHETGDRGPQLQPNPATDEVKVTGAGGKVTEVALLDMHGRPTALFLDTDSFSVAALATGSYIVRVTTLPSDGRPQQVHYLKLVKK